MSILLSCDKIRINSCDPVPEFLLDTGGKPSPDYVNTDIDAVDYLADLDKHDGKMVRQLKATEIHQMPCR